MVVLAGLGPSFSAGADLGWMGEQSRLSPEANERNAEAMARMFLAVARCPKARLDPATRQFLDTGEPAQLPDLDTLRAHDARLA